MFDLNTNDGREALETRIQDDIDSYCQKLYGSEHRKHLGASVMGEPCSRKLFYTFRWCKKVLHEGRILRLFNVGHEAEPRFVKYLKGIGFEVKSHSDNGEQFRINAHNGHYGGSLDGMCKPPKEYGLNEDLIFLDEFKTNNTGKGFNDVSEYDLSKAKPKHYAQMCQYGKHYGLKYGLYLIENKNDSDIAIKIVPLDWNYGTILENKAGDIINSKFPPARISNNAAFFECKFCDFSDICHNDAPVERNCRSCKMASPVEKAQWFCDKFNLTIPEDFVARGCDSHMSINLR